MKCTACGETVKPVVALDIDGTLGSYHPHFTAFAELYLGKRLPSSYEGGESFWGYLGLDLATYRQVKLAYRQGGMKRSMPVIRGAHSLFTAVQMAGAEVWVTTTRPYLRLDNIDPDTRFWLEQSGMQPDYMLYDEDKYGQLAERVATERVVGVLDDLPEQLERCDELFGESVGIMPVHRWTSGVLRHPAASTLATAADMLVSRIHGWYEERKI